MHKRDSCRRGDEVGTVQSRNNEPCPKVSTNAPAVGEVHLKFMYPDKATVADDASLVDDTLPSSRSRVRHKQRH